MSRRAGRWLDERTQQGRGQGLLYLTHPGPSLLVTAVFVAVASLAAHAAPSPFRVLQLIGVMLPIQFAIGVINDVADVAVDTAAKTYKPLVRGVVNRRDAALLGAVLAALGMAIAATVNPLTLAFAVAGLCAGLLYDIGARRTVWSLVPWWGGIVALPFAAFAAAARVSPALALVIPLGLLVALGLHCANALPDIDADRAAGQRSLPVHLGVIRARSASLVALALAAVLAAVTSAGTRAAWFVFGAAVCLGAVVTVVAVSRPRRPFPALAIAMALLAVAWLAAR